MGKMNIKIVTTVHVIMMNDSVKEVYRGAKSYAQRRMNELREEHFEIFSYSPDKYDNAYFWHIVSVPMSKTPRQRKD